MEDEKITTLKSETIDKEILVYLQNMFKRLNIEVRNDYKGKLFELMESGKLRDWCWQSSRRSIHKTKDPVGWQPVVREKHTQHWC